MKGSRASGCDVICTKPAAMVQLPVNGRSVCVTSSARRATAHPPREHYRLVLVTVLPTIAALRVEDSVTPPRFGIVSLAKYCPTQVLMMAYYGLIYPHLTYELKFRETCQEAFKNLQLLTLPSLYILETTLFCMSKCAMTNGRDIHVYETRGRDNYRTGRHRTVVYEHLPSKAGLPELTCTVVHTGDVRRFVCKIYHCDIPRRISGVHLHWADNNIREADEVRVTYCRLTRADMHCSPNGRCLPELTCTVVHTGVVRRFACKTYHCDIPRGISGVHLHWAGNNIREADEVRVRTAGLPELTCTVVHTGVVRRFACKIYHCDIPRGISGVHLHWADNNIREADEVRVTYCRLTRADMHCSPYG
ncbi:hypothetical protein J6590_036558 [Homalodisca vitripennis]|nr:hypothetical protein J6590_036558 [Homalodisca vitripennis]